MDSPSASISKKEVDLLTIAASAFLQAKQLVEDVAWRKQWAKKVGLGFKLTDLQLEIGQPGQLSATKTQPAKAA